MIANSSLAEKAVAEAFTDPTTARQFAALMLDGFTFGMRQSPYGSGVILTFQKRPAPTPLAIALEMDAVKKGEAPSRPVRVRADVFLPDTIRRAIAAIYRQFIETPEPV